MVSNYVIHTHDACAHTNVYHFLFMCRIMMRHDNEDNDHGTILYRFFKDAQCASGRRSYDPLGILSLDNDHANPLGFAKFEYGHHIYEKKHNAIY